jgi:hypothetical protein
METLNYPERRLPADSLASANRQPLIYIDDVHTLAQGIVDTIRDPLLVLDQHLRVVSANRAFCQTFRIHTVVVALAAKLVRVVWALLRNGTSWSAVHVATGIEQDR